MRPAKLVGLGNEGFESLRAAWEAGESEAGQALRKALRIGYYLVRHVWNVDDITIAEKMNEAAPDSTRNRSLKFFVSCVMARPED